MKCKLFQDTPAAPTLPPNTDILPEGSIIDDPSAYMLVQIGMAESADDECTKAVNRTPAQLNQARYEYSRTKKGIHPDDFTRYDRGEIDGYNMDGSDVPGPNPAEEDEEESSIILPENYNEEDD